MSVGYTGIQWNRQKRAYDLTLLLAVVLGLAAFAGFTVAFHPEATAEMLLIRGTALTAFALLHVTLCIGPLARLDRRFLPLLYNRRHLGVTTFLLGGIHAVLVTIQFHWLAPGVNPLVSLFTAYRRDYLPVGLPGAGPAHFPFEPLGVAALGILFLMAATSHDFWLKNLGPSFWKTLHLLVLGAYGLLVAHVVLGLLQSERSPVYPVLLGLGAATVVGLHLAAGLREARGDRAAPVDTGEWVPAGPASAVAEGRGRVVRVAGRRVALFRHEGRIYGLSNVCRHQGGPLGEGRILDGCVTCPWHGWQYRPEDGTSPPPFDERVPTYRLRLTRGMVYVRAEPDPPGTRQSGAVDDQEATDRPHER